MNFKHFSNFDPVPAPTRAMIVYMYYNDNTLRSVPHIFSTRLIERRLFKITNVSKSPSMASNVLVTVLYSASSYGFLLSIIVIYECVLSTYTSRY